MACLPATPVRLDLRLCAQAGAAALGEPARAQTLQLSDTPLLASAGFLVKAHYAARHGVLMNRRIDLVLTARIRVSMSLRRLPASVIMGLAVVRARWAPVDRAGELSMRC